MSDKLDDRDFYELMQTYRHADRFYGSPLDTVAAFEAVKKWIRENYEERK